MQIFSANMRVDERIHLKKNERISKNMIFKQSHTSNPFHLILNLKKIKIMSPTLNTVIFPLIKSYPVQTTIRSFLKSNIIYILSKIFYNNYKVHNVGLCAKLKNKFNFS